MVGIAPGAVLTFKLDEDITCRVLDNRNVGFEGEKISLSGAALSVMRQRGNNWKAVQGAAYWIFEGKTLKEHRELLESSE